MTTISRLAAALLLLASINAQGIPRRGPTYPGLARRQNDSCAGCNFCASAYRVTWTPNPIPDSATATVSTIIEVIDPDGGAPETSTVVGTYSEQWSTLYSSFSSSNLENTHSSSLSNGQVVTFPTGYIFYQDEWVWQSSRLADGTCSFASISTVLGPTPATLTEAPVPLKDNYPDPKGVYYSLTWELVDAELGQYLGDEVLQTCAPDCANANFGPYKATATQIVAGPAITPQLTVAFVTACQRSTKGAGTIESCSPVKGADSAAAGPTNPGSAAGGSGGGGERLTTVDSTGRTIIVAGSTPTGSGTGGLHATTNAQGATVIVTAGSAGEGDSSGVSGSNGGNEAAAAAAGQVTLVNGQGSTVVVQGGHLASGGPGITVTDERGSLMVIQGGVTGTLQAGVRGSTELVAGTVTQTDWQAGESISGAPGAEGGSGAASTTGSSDDAATRPLSLPLVFSGGVVLATVVACLIL